MNRLAWWLSILLTLVLACGSDDEPANPGGGGGGGGTHTYTYSLANAFPNLTFPRPTDIQNAGDGTNRIFVVEQLGRIMVFANDAAVTAATEFLDITSEVQGPTQSEMGLLGLAFHPDYESNGYFFVMYESGTSAARLERVSRFTVSADPDVADPASEKILLEWSDQFPNHNGGALVFGGDGYLYISIGDEGGAGDPNDNAQNRARIFGKILRIDVDQNVNTTPYHGVPSDNPYVGNGSGYREDIWAYGMRNAWRVSYDAPSGRLITGDVGQDDWEEIDIITRGGNYGWDCREGLSDYNENDDPSSPLCASATGLVEPILAYSHSEGESITGGYVYRGPTATSLTGKYVYADYISGRIWALDVTAKTTRLLDDTNLFLSTFGVAQNNELLVAGYFADGTPTSIYRIVQTEETP